MSYHKLPSNLNIFKLKMKEVLSYVLPKSSKNPGLATMGGNGGFRATLAGFVALLVLQTATAFGAGTLAPQK